MAKLTDLSLDDLYSRKITSSVEAVIQFKDDFSKKSDRWCEQVCKLNCKSPPVPNRIVPTEHVDVLIIQDHRAFDEPKFRKSGIDIEKKHRQIIDHIAKIALKGADRTNLRYAVTELLRCQITAADVKKGKAPTDTVLSKCRPYLFKEIELRKPKVIISLSNSVTKVLTKETSKLTSNYTARGEITTTADGIPVVIAAHPRILLMLRQNSSGQMWGPDFYRVVCNDFLKAAKLVRGDLVVRDLDEAIEEAKKQIHVARSMNDVKAFVSELMDAGLEGKVLSYDLETTSLDPYESDARILTAQFGYRPEEDGPIKAIVFPLWHRANKGYDPQEAWLHITPLLTHDEISKIGHNIKFDIIYTAVTTGIRIRNVLFDTLLLLHGLNSGLQGMYGLKKAVHDWIPELGLGGYEDKLPKLSKKSADAEEETEEEEDEDAE